MRILITGATGFVGANLVRRLCAKSHEVHIFTRKTSSQWRIKDVHRLKNHVVDLLDKPRLKNLCLKIKPEVVYHLATAGIYDGCHIHENKQFENNFTGTWNLIEALSKVDYRCFVNTGSSSEYGPKSFAMRESDVCEPVNIYGISKLASTLLCQHVGRKEKRPIVTLRLFSPYGPWDEKVRLIPYSVMRCLEKKPLELAHPGSVRDYVFIEDCLDLYEEVVLKAGRLQGEIFNVACGRQHSVETVVSQIRKKCQSKSLFLWQERPGREFDQGVTSWRANMLKTFSVFQWRPKTKLSAGLDQTIRWFKKQKEQNGH